MYVYIQSESRLYTVGFYMPDGKFMPESDHNDAGRAASRVSWLNGGADPALYPVLPPVESVPSVVRDATRGPVLYTTEQVIALGPTMAFMGMTMNADAPRRTLFTMFRATIGGPHPKHLRFWRTAHDEWACDLMDSSRPVKNSDEKFYTAPRYLRTFVENNLTIDEHRYLRWTAEEGGW